MERYILRTLSLDHQRLISKFNCGNDVLNTYLKKKAFLDYDAVTYLAIDIAEKRIISFFSLSCSGLYLRYREIFNCFPAVEIKNFATDVNYQHRFLEKGITYSQSILALVKYHLIRDFTDNICGASRIILYSAPSAVGFYKNASFIDFNEDFVTDGSNYLEGCIPLIYHYD